MTRKQLGLLRLISIAGPLMLILTRPGGQATTAVLAISLAFGIASAALTPTDAAIPSEDVPDR